MHLSEVATIMTEVEYLQARRETDKEWVAEFKAKYDIPSQRVHEAEEHGNPRDWYEAHAHHAEYAPASH